MFKRFLFLTVLLCGVGATALSIVWFGGTPQADAAAPPSAALDCGLCVLEPQPSAVDVGGSSDLLVESGASHMNGDLIVQKQSSFSSIADTEVVGTIECKGNGNPACPPSGATAGGDPVPDLLAGLPDVPTSLAAQSWPNCGKNETCTAPPGVYSGLSKVAKDSTILLQPGYYVFDGRLDVQGSLGIDAAGAPDPEAGAGVALFFTSGGTLDLSKDASVNLISPTAGPFEAVSIYYDRGNTSDLTFRGSQFDFPGYVYAPASQLFMQNDSEWEVRNRFLVGSVKVRSGVQGVINPDAWSGWPGTFQPVIDVSPIFECFTTQPDGTFSAFFGYENNTVGEGGGLIEASVGLGPDNVVDPIAFDGQQPVTFDPGRTAIGDAEPNAFVIAGWDGSAITWTLLGRTATADLVSTSCDPLPQCQGQDATIIGDDTDEVIIGTPGVDVILAGAGNDVIDGLGGDDVICGEDGEDFISGGNGADRLDGGSGDDVLDGGSEGDELVGDSGDDVLLGEDGPDVIDGGDGDDAIRGGLGDDTLAGDSGRDSIDGGGGADVCDVDLFDVEVAC